MANWWDNFISNPLGGVQDWLSGGINRPTAGYRPDFTAPQMAPAVSGQRSSGSSSASTPQLFGGPDRFAGATPMPRQMAPQDMSFMGMSPEELLGYILGGGGGGGVNTAAYNPLLEDIAAREAGLGTRRGEQQAYLTSLFDAAEARALADREALAAAIDAQLATDAERRATEIGLIQSDEAARRATADAARGALGVTPGADLSTAVAENAAGGVGATGSVAERDARIRQSIGEQQLNREISGLTPIEASYLNQLNTAYEDRLSALASERANIMGQIAAARSRGGGGPSPSERMNALQFVQGVFGPGEQAQMPGVAGYLQGLGMSVPPQLIPELINLGSSILQTATRSNIDPGSLAGAQELLNMLVTSDPAAASLLNSYPGATGIVLDYVMEASK